MATCMVKLQLPRRTTDTISRNVPSATKVRYRRACTLYTHSSVPMYSSRATSSLHRMSRNAPSRVRVIMSPGGTLELEVRFISSGDYHDA